MKPRFLGIFYNYHYYFFARILCYYFIKLFSVLLNWHLQPYNCYHWISILLKWWSPQCMGETICPTHFFIFVNDRVCPTHFGSGTYSCINIYITHKHAPHIWNSQIFEYKISRPIAWGLLHLDKSTTPNFTRLDVCPTQRILPCS